MKAFAGFMARQPLLFNSIVAGIGLGGVYFAPFKDPEIQKSLAGLIVAAFLFLTHQTVVSPATNLAQNAEAAKLAVTQLDGMQVGATGVLPMTAEPVINTIALEVAGKAGGAAGKLAEKVAGDVLGKVTGRFGRLLHRG